MSKTLFDREPEMTPKCEHQHLIRIPYFPGDKLVCRDCGADGCTAGYANGIRDYYLPGDPPWRRQAELLKRKWALGELSGGEDLEQCPACCFVGTIDDFDVMGCDYGHLFCNQCGLQFAQ